MTRKWQLKDIIMMGILGLLFAGVYLGALYAGIAVTAVLTPVGLAPFGYEIFYGIWFMGATLAAYIIQKPGTAIVTEVIAAVLELLMGNIGGPLVVIAGIIQGLGCELGFALFKYKRYDLLSLSASGICAAVFIFIWGFVQSGYVLLAPSLLVAMLAVRVVSALLFSGLLSSLIGAGLARTGVLKSYALGASRKAPEIMDD